MGIEGVEDQRRHSSNITKWMSESMERITSETRDRDGWRILVGEGRPKWAPEVKWATPITANLVNAMAKIMMLVSNPSREGTM